MTTFEKILNDALMIVTSCLKSDVDKICMRETCVGFWKVSNLMDLKIAYMNDKINRISNLRIAGNLVPCVNSGCYCQQMGMTKFYYPEELCEPHDEDEDPYGPNFEYRYRFMACKESICVDRYIPYCMVCMTSNVNVGTRSDGLEVPYIAEAGDNNL